MARHDRYRRATRISDRMARERIPEQHAEDKRRQDAVMATSPVNAPTFGVREGPARPPIGDEVRWDLRTKSREERDQERRDALKAERESYRRKRPDVMARADHNGHLTPNKHAADS